MEWSKELTLLTAFSIALFLKKIIDIIIDPFTVATFSYYLGEFLIVVVPCVILIVLSKFLLSCVVHDGSWVTLFISNESLHTQKRDRPWHYLPSHDRAIKCHKEQLWLFYSIKWMVPFNKMSGILLNTLIMSFYLVNEIKR